jgi:hypothetical protein
MSDAPNSSLLVIAGKTAQNPSQYLHPLQIIICLETSNTLSLSGAA